MVQAPEWFPIIYVLVLLAVGVLPLYTFFRGTFHLGRMHKRAIGALIDKGEMKEAADLLVRFTGAGSLNRNSTRVTLALTLFVLLGLMTIHILFFDAPAASDAFRTVFAMVGSLLSAVVGFYFGGKATEKSLSKAVAHIDNMKPEELLARFMERSDPKALDDAVGAIKDRRRQLVA